MPCVSTDEGGIPDIIEDGKTGLIALRKDAHDLTNKLEWMIVNPIGRTAMGNYGRDQYQKKYTDVQFERNISNIFHAITMTQ